MAKVTIFDVAKKAGVSPATVSRVMNDGVCKKETKQKVFEAIKALDFVPNQSARNLGSVNSSKRVAILIPNDNSYVFNQMLNGIKDITQIYGFDFNVFTYKDQKEFDYATNKISNSSEYLGIIEISKPCLIKDKKIVSLFDDLIDVEIKHQIKDKKCLIDVEDDTLQEFLSTILLKDIKQTKQIKSCECIIVESIEQASKYLNQGVDKQIYVLEPCCNTAKLLDITPIFIDMYAIGVILIRKIIKQVLKKDNNTKVMVTI